MNVRCGVVAVNARTDGRHDIVMSVGRPLFAANTARACQPALTLRWWMVGWRRAGYFARFVAGFFGAAGFFDRAAADFATAARLGLRTIVIGAGFVFAAGFFIQAIGSSP